MIILHAGLMEGEFFLWGEAPLGKGQPTKDLRGKRKAWVHLNRNELLPYDAGGEVLIVALKTAGVAWKVSKKSVVPIRVWLPTANDHPFPSSTLIGEPPKGVASTSVRPWKVTSLRLPRELLVEFLCGCIGKQTLGSGVILGKDIAFWATALRFAGALVAKQQFLPTVMDAFGVTLAVWKPVFSGPEAEKFSSLVKSMPVVARALTKKTSSAPDTPSSAVLTEFLVLMLDHLVRSSIGVRSVPANHRKQNRAPYDSVHDAWLDALRLPDGVMQTDPAGFNQLSAQIKDWERPIAISSTGPFKLCFRIEEPKSDEKKLRPVGKRDKTWYVRYLIQATHDPSLLIPAEDVWKGKDVPSLDEEFDAHEYLLLSLGQASRICDHIEASLRKSTPAGYKLDANGAYEFLTQKALTLEQWGFGVMLPAWWTRKGAKLRPTARARVKTPEMQGVSGLSLDEIVDFDWEVALGGEKLSYEELQRLANLKAPLVKVRGQWVQVDPEEIHSILQFWKKGQGRTTVREVVRMALGGDGGTSPRGIPFEGVTAVGWIGDLIAELDGRTPFQKLSPPEGFQGMLRPYQVRGYSWLNFLRRWGLGACLADDMGLGKTIQTLALIQRDWHSGKRRPVLLICPTSVVNNWSKEAARFTSELPVMVHHGIERMKGEKFERKAVKQAIVITSYALLNRDFETFKEVDWAGVVLDEAQNIKNPETKQAKAARAVEADYRIALTGTPVENNVGDLWSIMEFLNPGFLGSRREFKEAFFIPIQAGRDPEAAEKLKRLTGPFVLRRLKTDKTIIADLPEKMEMKVFCTLTREQASLYEAVVKEAVRGLDDTEGIQRKGIVLATLSKLKQVCNHPAHFLGDNSPIPGRSGKLARLTEMVEEMTEVGDRALIFSQFAEMGEILKKHLQETFGREVLFLHGGVSRKQRDWMVERFQSDGDDLPLFILSLKAGGTGLNLTRANHVIHFDRWWNPAVENQATDRAFRIGQTKNVEVHKFICAGTLEDKIDEMIERKKEIAERVIGAGEGWLTELSTSELKDLFALRKEAIGD
jgi:SNF2 family DNA or RNA helicase